MELYAKKITSVPTKENDPSGGGGGGGGAGAGNDEEQEQQSAADVAKAYRDIVHSHEVGAHAKDNVASNWLDPDTGLLRVKHERKSRSSSLSLSLPHCLRLILARFCLSCGRCGGV